MLPTKGPDAYGYGRYGYGYEYGSDVDAKPSKAKVMKVTGKSVKEKTRS
jgi:succinoglycan biosynthesis transport protein ExoP